MKYNAIKQCKLGPGIRGEKQPEFLPLNPQKKPDRVHTSVFPTLLLIKGGDRTVGQKLASAVQLMK